MEEADWALCYMQQGEWAFIAQSWKGSQEMGNY